MALLPSEQTHGRCLGTLSRGDVFGIGALVVLVIVLSLAGTAPARAILRTVGAERTAAPYTEIFFASTGALPTRYTAPRSALDIVFIARDHATAVRTLRWSVTLDASGAMSGEVIVGEITTRPDQDVLTHARFVVRCDGRGSTSKALTFVVRVQGTDQPLVHHAVCVGTGG
jgi:hypothetical protein